MKDLVCGLPVQCSEPRNVKNEHENGHSEKTLLLLLEVLGLEATAAPTPISLGDHLWRQVTPLVTWP